MKKFWMFLLFVLHPHLQAATEIDSPKFAKLLRFPGLPLETIDYTKRESAVRGIEFKKVLYLKVVGREFDFPAAIYIAPKDRIDKSKYDRIRNMVHNTELDHDELIKKIGFAYLPEMDNAVVCMDQIKMSKLIPTPSAEGQAWITTNVGGLSITCSSEKLNLDYQIFLFGNLESDQEIIAKYRTDHAQPSPDEFRAFIREMVHLVRDSPSVAAQGSGGGAVSERRNPASQGNPDGEMDGSLRPTGRVIRDDAISGSADIRRPIWPWLLGSILLACVCYAVIRHKRINT